MQYQGPVVFFPHKANQYPLATWTGRLALND